MNEKNLIADSWLPVSDLTGTRRKEKLSLVEIVNAEVGDISAPRADFRGAIYQLLIGLLQASFAPANRKEWVRYWQSPPDQKVLHEALVPFHSAFEIVNIDGAAFMQDYDLQGAEKKAIDGLLIDAPGAKTIKDNKDHFHKRSTFDAMSAYWAAIALFTLQINAPSGGVGHRVSLRGGGPLTTLLLPPALATTSSLWHRLWINVLPVDYISEKLQGDQSLQDLEFQFPWMVNTRTSEKKGGDTLPLHCHPLQCFWSMPRRIRLHVLEESGQCALTGEDCDSIVRTFETKNYGVNYAGPWIHPLTPYIHEDGNVPNSLKAQPGGIKYRHWLGIALNSKDGKYNRAPATVVTHYHESKRDWIAEASGFDEADHSPRLWVFGYDMDNMKARCWYDSIMPLYSCEIEIQNDISATVEPMVTAAVEVNRILRSALKSAWFNRPKDVKGDMSFVDANFWSATEPMFFQSIQEQITSVRNGQMRGDKEVNIAWLKTITKTAYDLFDQFALTQAEGGKNMQRIVTARDGKGGLSHMLNGNKTLKGLKADG